jgi:hypothetical protein
VPSKTRGELDAPTSAAGYDGFAIDIYQNYDDETIGPNEQRWR